MLLHHDEQLLDGEVHVARVVCSAHHCVSLASPCGSVGKDRRIVPTVDPFDEELCCVLEYVDLAVILVKSDVEGVLLLFGAISAQGTFIVHEFVGVHEDDQLG